MDEPYALLPLYRDFSFPMPIQFQSPHLSFSFIDSTLAPQPILQSYSKWKGSLVSLFIYFPIEAIKPTHQKPNARLYLHPSSQLASSRIQTGSKEMYKRDSSPIIIVFKKYHSILFITHIRFTHSIMTHFLDQLITYSRRAYCLLLLT